MRDGNAETRDGIRWGRDALGDQFEPTTEFEAVLIQRLKAVTAQAEADRARATGDRARAASEREELATELRSAHLDHLTGAYRREMGRLAISNEIERARRSDQGLVLAFVDVDRLKAINDNEGHAAGDRVLQTVVQAIRTNLRSFDPVSRYGGDEFVCGLAGVDLLEAKRRFSSINAAIKAEVHVEISVGLAELADGDTVDRLTERADMAMLRVKARHHAAVERHETPSS
jgi:diguanylate cyclase (GGDEF)-like protein